MSQASRSEPKLITPSGTEQSELVDVDDHYLTHVRAALSSHDPHRLAQDAVTDSAVNAIARHDVHVPAETGRQMSVNGREVDQVEIGAWIVVDDYVDVARPLGFPARNRAEYVKRGDAPGSQGILVGLDQPAHIVDGHEFNMGEKRVKAEG